MWLAKEIYYLSYAAPDLRDLLRRRDEDKLGLKRDVGLQRV